MGRSSRRDAPRAVKVAAPTNLSASSPTRYRDGMRQIIPAVAACFVLSLAGCAHTRPAETTSALAGKLRDVALSSDIRKICKIEDTDRTPKFDFDSSDLSGADREVLVQVARCM